MILSLLDHQPARHHSFSEVLALQRPLVLVRNVWQRNFEGLRRAERIKGAIEHTEKHENMKKTLIPIIVATFGLAASPALLAQGCCSGGGGAMKEGCSMGGMAGAAVHDHGAGQGAATSQSAAPKAVLAQPVQAVFDSYITVQGALAQDSLKGVSTAATAMAKAIQADSKKALSPKVAQQTQALANAKDLATARDAFKSLSDSLIQYLKDQKVAAGSYYVAYCPMAKASWLQTDKTIMNPYMGKGMLHCGQIKS